MSRRILWFLCILLFVLSAPVEAQQPTKVPRVKAQQPKKVPRVGYLAAVSASADRPRLEAFRQGLRDLGYVEGQNIIIDYRHEDRGFERLPTLQPSWSS